VNHSFKHTDSFKNETSEYHYKWVNELFILTIYSTKPNDSGTNQYKWVSESFCIFYRNTEWHDCQVLVPITKVISLNNALIIMIS